MRVAIVGLLVFSISGCQTAVPTPPPAPTYNWVKARSETIAVTPGGDYGFGPVVRPGKIVRYDVHASLPVSTGVFSQWKWNSNMRIVTTGITVGQLTNPEQALALLYGPQSGAQCYETNILVTAQTCTVDDTQSRIFIHDLRTSRDAVGTVLAALIGANQPLQNQLSQNTVSFDLYAWECVANCPVL